MINTYPFAECTLSTRKTEVPITDTTLLNFINGETYKKDYNSLTFPLLYDHIKYDEAIAAIKAIQQFLENHKL